MADMANLIDITSNILSQNTICFETREINQELIPNPIQNANFGIINFTAITSEEIYEEIDFLFVIDCSGSMSYACSDGISKMNHIIHTLKNIILFFHEHPNININITINAFDTTIYPIVSRTKVTDYNFNKIIYKIEKIVPRGSTNIEYALKKSSNIINNLLNEFPTNNINHIFMTDGEANEGSKDIALLQSILNPRVTNTFIGFGIDHDASLLNAISSINKGAYHFIDKLDSAGLVYGEILHGILYKLITNSEIIIENGLVYDFKTNKWVNSLSIGDIASEANKIYNIISNVPNKCKVNIKGSVGDLVVLFPSSLNETSDLTNQIYRQRTLQLLYEVNDFCNRKRTYDDSHDDNILYFEHENTFEHENNDLQIKLTNFIQEIKKYITDNNLEEDKFLKNLCDDIYVCYRTIGTRFGTMFCTARQTSQGTQRQYTASSITEDIYNSPRIPVLNRQIIQHDMSNFDDTPYLTPQATEVMREISKIVKHSDYTQEY